MNKILHFALLLSFFLTAGAVSAQTNFKFSKTTYVGALSNDANADWTQGWTNWDPKNANYGAPTDLVTLDASATGEKMISGTLTLDAAKIYLLKGLVVVPSGAKLVIPAGTIIRAQSDLSSTPKNYASIVVERGGKIEINGTANNPVVITSAKPVGQRDRGDWGGLLLAGRSHHNLNDATYNNVQMEGFNNISFDPSLAKFGGNDPNDNSGFIHFLRLEFGGLAFEANKEINGLTFGAIGAATEVDHIQVSYSGDDSYEWFGGTVNTKYLIAFKGTDDDFDTDNGYGGLNQFGIGVRDSAYYDLSYNAPSGSSTSEGFESDNEASGTAAVKPYTNAVFSNYTMIGPVPVGSTWSQMNTVTKAAFRRGARIRRNSSERIVNSIFMGYRNFLMVDGDSSLRNTNYSQVLALVNPNTAVDQQSKQIFYANNLIVNTLASSNSSTDTTANGLVEVTKAVGCGNKLAALNNWVRQGGCNANNIDPVAFTTGTVLENPLSASVTPNFRPVAGSPALSGADFICNPVLANLSTATHEIEEAIQYSPVYPNPIHGGVLNFGREVVSYGLFDTKGNMVRFGLDTDNALIEGLPAGVYFLKLDGQMQKLIVE